MFCHVSTEQVVGVHDVSSVYHVPLLLQSQGIVGFLQRRLNLTSIPYTPAMKQRGSDLESRWRALTGEYVSFLFLHLVIRDRALDQKKLTLCCSQERLFDRVSIVLVGKYTDLKDSYMSVTKALEHSAFRCHQKLVLQVRAFPRLVY